MSSRTEDETLQFGPAAWATRHPRWSSLVLGGLAALGFPPLNLWPVALAAMGAFVFLAWRSANWKAAFFNGWLFGVALFTVTNNWIATAFTYQANMPALLGWAAVPLLSLYLAVWPAFATLVAWLTVRRGGLTPFAIAFGACWIAAEWFRSWVFTGYAWGPFSLAMMGAVGPAGFGDAFCRSSVPTPFPACSWRCAASLPPWCCANGSCLLPPSASCLPPWFIGPPVRGGRELCRSRWSSRISSRRRWTIPLLYEEQFQRAGRLSLPQQQLDRRLVLWPESGVPDYLRDGYPQRYYDMMTAGGDPDFARFRIGKVIGEGSLLLTGTQDLEIGMRGWPASCGRRLQCRDADLGRRHAW